MQYFRFEDPWLLLLLLIIPFLLAVNRKERRAVLQFSSIQKLQTLQTPGIELPTVIPVALRFLAIFLLVLGLARPQEGRKSTEILSTGVDIILAIDTSGSMQALDFQKDNQRVTRLEVVKDVVNEFVQNREYDRIGMVAFGQEAFTQCPLTLDHGILLSFLDKMKIGMAGDSTAIGSAIGISVKRIKELKSKSKVIILLTDGRNNAGELSPIKAAEIANDFGIKIYTIGVGTRGKAPFLVDTIYGERLVYQEVDIDEDTLKKISDFTGAKYFRATDLKSLKDIYQQIDSLEKSEVKVIDHTQFKELFPYFLVPTLFLILLEIILSNTLFRRIP